MNGNMKRVYFNDKHAIIVDELAKTYCYVSDPNGIVIVKDMLGIFTFHGNLKKQESELISRKYTKDPCISNFHKINKVGSWEPLH